MKRVTRRITMKSERETDKTALHLPNNIKTKMKRLARNHTKKKKAAMKTNMMKTTATKMISRKKVSATQLPMTKKVVTAKI